MPSANAHRNGANRSPLAEQCIHSLFRTDGLIRRLAEVRLIRFGVTSCQWGILRVLQRNESAGMLPPKMMELGEMLLVQPPSLTAAIDRMTRSGIVTRIDDEHDHRSRRVELTDAGRDILARAMVDHGNWQGTLMGGLSKAEQRTMLALLNKLTGHLAELGESGTAKSEEIEPGTLRPERGSRS